MAITGHRKIAALLLNLDPEAAAKILQNLHEDNLATVGIAMAVRRTSPPAARVCRGVDHAESTFLGYEAGPRHRVAIGTLMGSVAPGASWRSGGRARWRCRPLRVSRGRASPPPPPPPPPLAQLSAPRAALFFAEPTPLAPFNARARAGRVARSRS